MSRIQELFKRKPKGVLNVYYTAGFPRLDSTLEIIRSLEACGADLVELGMPYSDPLADGPVIQASSSVALANGMTIATLFEQLQDLRKQVRLPVILMGYMNPLLQYGFEKFCADAAAVGVDGLILPDLPAHEFRSEYGAVIRQYGLDFSFLVTPETPEERVRELDALSSGFLYAVSSSSTTGNNRDFEPVRAYLAKLSAMRLRNPVLLGFGVRDRQSFLLASEYVNGAIIGTAYIKALEGTSDAGKATREFLQTILT